MHQPTSILAAALTLLVLAACRSDAVPDAELPLLGDFTVHEHILIEDAWVRAAPRRARADEADSPAAEATSIPGPPPAGTNSAAYMRIRNRSEESDRLVSATSLVAGATELHQAFEDDGVMRMRDVDAISLPASAAVELEPGGLHIMLIDLQRLLVPGDSVDLRLRFEATGEIVVRAEVRE